ncbi:MAG: prepilin peptidase [Candidatus Dormibacteria bacterium]
MSGAAALVATPAGALAGLAAGWLCVRLENVEKLAEEEREDRDAYERHVAEERDAALAEGREVPAAAPWEDESFGWTWRERWLAPLLGAAGFAAFAAHEPSLSGFLVHALWLTFFVQVVVFDLKHRLILNRVTYPAVVVALGLSSVSPGLDIPRSVAGAVAVGLFFFMLNVVSRGGIGLGDAKLGAVIGAVCGLSGDLNHLGAAYAVLYGILLGGAASIVLLVLRLRGLKDPIPYGPFLCAGAALILFHGP